MTTEHTRLPIPKNDASLFFDQQVEISITAQLGSVMEKTDIRSTEGPFLVLPEYRTQYPGTVTRALANLYAEYNQAFAPLVMANREWSTDYQSCISPEGTPINGWIQIDMVGLPQAFLDAAPSLDPNEVRETLRGKIFEIENSLAMYQLLANIFAFDSQDTLFKKEFFSSLDRLRQKHRRPIALLAVTAQKYQAMRESEFGKSDNEILTDAEIRTLSGFDHFFGPEDFISHLKENKCQSDYLLYVRSSDPVSKLRKPKTDVENPLLANNDVRRIIKANAVTFNIDRPDVPLGSPAKINDTKAYLPPMGMAFPVFSDEDLSSSNFREFLASQRIPQEQIESREVHLRAKPMQASYGCYGHQHAAWNNTKFLKDLRYGLRERGPYVIQPEMKTPILVNEADGKMYTYIDRNFLATDDDQNYYFMGGFRSLMPIDSQEANRGRVHGANATVWAEII